MIHYLIGDATDPQGPGPKMIAHVCNDIGAWGAGFTHALSKRWLAPEQIYRQTFEKKVRPTRGEIQVVPLSVQPPSSRMYAANLICQDGVGTDRVRIDYDALEVCLHDLNKWMCAYYEQTPMSLHIPRIGCGLAGGDWEEIKRTIKRTMDPEVYVYDLTREDAARY